MYKYTVSRGRDSDISKIACNAVFYVCFKSGFIHCRLVLFILVYCKSRDAKSCVSRGALLDMVVRMYSNESVYK